VTAETGHVLGTFDVITDFSAAQRDKINVRQMDASKLVAGSQDWTLVGAGDPFTAPGQIGVGTPNDGVAIQISGVHNVDAS
jgi:hypothetical protein